MGRAKTSPKGRDNTGRPTEISRRKLMVGVASGLGASVLASRGATQDAPDPRLSVPEDTTKLQGPPPTELGERSDFVRPRRRVFRPEPSSASQTPLQDLCGTVTPSDLHFERHHAGIPKVDPDRYTLLVHGMVERPTLFTLDELKRFPAISRLHFLECSGNGGEALRNPKPELTPQTVDGLTSTSDWTGVPLSLVFREVGAHPSARWFLAESQDAAVMTRSIPMGKAWDDALLAYGQNGEPLRPANGYPVRLFLPGWEGNANIKWLRRIEVSDRPFFTREETSKYTDPLPDGTARMFSFDMDSKSIITFPAHPGRLDGHGYWEIRGIAWSGRGRITRVEITTDGGATWEDAELQDPVLPKCHTRFRKLWRWQGQGATLMSRATDEAGIVQPTTKEFLAERGIGTRYHFNHLRAWNVDRSGRVTFALG